MNKDMLMTKVQSVEFMEWQQKAFGLILDGTVNRVDHPQLPISIYKVQTIIRIDVKEVFPKVVKE